MEQFLVIVTLFQMGLEANTLSMSDKAQNLCVAKVKSKNRVNCIDCFDLDNDGVWPQLVTL